MTHNTYYTFGGTVENQDSVTNKIKDVIDLSKTEESQLKNVEEAVGKRDVRSIAVAVDIALSEFIDYLPIVLDEKLDVDIDLEAEDFADVYHDICQIIENSIAISAFEEDVDDDDDWDEEVEDEDWDDDDEDESIDLGESTYDRHPSFHSVYPTNVNPYF